MFQSLVQKGAAAAYSEAGRQQMKGLIDFYMTNAKLLREGLESVGITVYGGAGKGDRDEEEEGEVGTRHGAWMLRAGRGCPV